MKTIELSEEEVKLVIHVIEPLAGVDYLSDEAKKNVISILFKLQKGEEE